MYPISFRSSRAKMAPNLSSSKHAGLVPLSPAREGRGEPISHLIKDKRRHSSRPVKAHGGDLLCSQGGDCTLFLPQRGAMTGESGGQLSLPSSAGKATFTQPPGKKKKKKTQKKNPQNLKTKDPPPLTVTYLQKERDPKKTIGFPKKVRGFHQKSWKCTPYLPAF